MPQVGDHVPEKSAVSPLDLPRLSHAVRTELISSLTPRARLAWRIAFGVIVIAVWLTASLNAPARIF
jgi:hypothetical protein